MKNKPWKMWKTRKKVFIAVCLLWLATAILGLSGRPIDDGIVDFIFGAGKWLLSFGIALVLSDKAVDELPLFKKGEVGEDEEEIYE